MGITTLFTTALKGVSWQKIAGMAMEYGPEIYRKARDRFRKDDPQPERQGAEAELRERIGRLEKLLLEQEEVIREQVARSERLQEACLKLEGALKLFKVVTALLAFVALVLAVMLIRQG